MVGAAEMTRNPNAGVRMSPEGRAKMRATEKVVLRYYNDMGKNKGHCTWGAGFLAHKGVCSPEELTKKVSGQMVDQEFERRVAEAERIVHRNITVPLNQAQFDALCSLVYNSGARGARETFRFVNQNDFEGAAHNMMKMIKVSVVEGGVRKHIIAPGLIKRRQEESAPFRGQRASGGATQ